MVNKKKGIGDEPMPAGSTIPLVSVTVNNVPEDEGYCPYENRSVEHPTTNMETFIHLLKGCLGSGILAMPMAIQNAGLMFGLVSIIIIGIVCTYCMNLLVRCSYILCRKNRVPSMGFAEVAEVAMRTGPLPLRRFSKVFKGLVNTFLVLDLLGCCCVYVVFVAENVLQVFAKYYYPIDSRLFMLMMMPFVISICMIRNLKILTPFSSFANGLIMASIGITMYYVFQDMPSIESVSYIVDWRKWPLFFSIAIFALEGIGVVMPLENNMLTPKRFIGSFGVLNIGMGVVSLMYATVGFFGYLKYGNTTHASITLNLPTEDLLAQMAKLMMAIAIFFTYALQFHVPFEIIWKGSKQHFQSKPLLFEYIFRVVLVIITISIAIALPDLKIIVQLVGALCLSFLGLILPSFIDLVINWEEPGLGYLYWRLWKNLAIMSVGLLGLTTGVYTSLLEIFEKFE